MLLLDRLGLLITTGLSLLFSSFMFLMNYSDSDLFTFPCIYSDSFIRVISLFGHELA
jgi:hypothetical protein